MYTHIFSFSCFLLSLLFFRNYYQMIFAILVNLSSRRRKNVSPLVLTTGEAYYMYVRSTLLFQSIGQKYQSINHSSFSKKNCNILSSTFEIGPPKCLEDSDMSKLENSFGSVEILMSTSDCSMISDFISISTALLNAVKICS